MGASYFLKDKVYNIQTEKIKDSLKKFFTNNISLVKETIGKYFQKIRYAEHLSLQNLLIYTEALLATSKSRWFQHGPPHSCVIHRSRNLVGN